MKRKGKEKIEKGGKKVKIEKLKIESKVKKRQKTKKKGRKRRK